MHTGEHRKVLILVVVGVVVMVLFVAGLAARAKENAERKKQEAGQYTDPRTGETVSYPANRTPETYGVEGNEPVILGMSHFFKHGVTKDQLDVLKKSFHAFAEQQGDKRMEISIAPTSMKKIPANPSAGNFANTITFTAQINRKEVHPARFEYEGIFKARLVVYAPNSNRPIYDSGFTDTQVPDSHGH